MIYANSLDSQLPIFQALSSELRVQIMNLILTHHGINLKQISKALGISMSTLSPHINRLSDCGLIRLEGLPAAHGTQKRCYPILDHICIDFDAKANLTPIYQSEIPVGHFSDFEVAPTCGLATANSFLGKLDEPRSFAHPERYGAGILWFTTGYIEYTLPNFIPLGQQIDQLSVTFEISSEAPKHNNHWPSEIHFLLNGTDLGCWVCPGDFGDRFGDQNPSWWYDFLNQYGLLKKLTINETGSFLDDEKLSEITVRDLNLNAQSVLKLRFQVPKNTTHSKGITLYGRGFGDHDQHIRMTIQYSPQNSTES